MTETTKPPRRPTSGRTPRSSERGGDKPRSRPAGDRPAGPRSGAPQRPGEPAPRQDDARIAKVMARAGLCSRRDAESWIAARRVAVNGTVIDSPALNVRPGDRITVDGMALPEREPTRLFLFHKPRGLVTTSRDPEGRPTIFETLPEGLPRVVSVGRLDINTEGLMLLTNDGGLARILELPATGWTRRYRVRANGGIDQARLDALKGGVTVDGVDYAGIDATLDRVQGANAWLTMGLREGKNREIKRVLESLGLAVTRLIRISFGPFQLGELAEGAVEAVPTRVLREQLGPTLMAEAGVDLEHVEERMTSGAGRRPPARPTAEAPRLGRSAAPAPRAHVSALRAARNEAANGESRRRIERGATADRKGRAVKVERVIPVGTVRDQRGAGTRNERRFADEQQDRAAPRQRTRADAERGDVRPARTRPAAVARSPRTGAQDRFGDRSRDERPRDARPGRTTERPPRERADTAGDRPRVARSTRSDDRPRSQRAGGFEDRPRGERVSAGGPSGSNLGGGKPSGSKPNGRPGGFGSERPATGRNKSAGATRPFGGDRPPGGSRPRGGGKSGSRPGGGRPPRGRE